ncbi:MAG: SH3 domain-containing protein [Leptospiraceae bacterium]|nr:SH3 domain-containing protein [Leptospiraceae bacterium]
MKAATLTSRPARSVISRLPGVIGLSCLFILSQCAREDSLVARYPVSVKQSPDKNAKVITWLSKAEEVAILDEQNDYTHVRLAGGKEGYVLSSTLARQALVITDDNLELKLRPSVSTGKSGSARNLRKGAVAFVIEEAQNDDGHWLHILGGSSRSPLFKPFQGWIRGEQGYDETPSLVRSAIDLEVAAEKKDLETLKKLVGKPEPINEIAAAQVVAIEGVPDEKLPEDHEIAPTNDSADELPEPEQPTTPQTNKTSSQPDT